MTQPVAFAGARVKMDLGALAPSECFEPFSFRHARQDRIAGGRNVRAGAEKRA